jgi:hypothetical protein
MHTLRAERDDRFSTLRIVPPIPAEELRNAANSVQFAGSEGAEWVPPQLQADEDASTITFESWAFGLNDDEKFTAYYHEVAEHLGITVIEVIT